MFHNDLNTFLIDSIVTHLEIVYNARFESNAHYKDLLLKTGEVPLIFKSDDPLLGIGSQENGLNLAGKVLMSIRANFRKTSNKIYVFGSDHRNYFWKICGC